ncbi:MAG: hypothetical protein QXO69_00865 [archaeon]
MPRKFSPWKVAQSMNKEHYYALDAKAKEFAKKHGIDTATAHTALLYLQKYPTATAKRAILAAERFWKTPKIQK